MHSHPPPRKYHHIAHFAVMQISCQFSQESLCKMCVCVSGRTLYTNTQILSNNKKHKFMLAHPFGTYSTSTTSMTQRRSGGTFPNTQIPYPTYAYRGARQLYVHKYGRSHHQMCLLPHCGRNMSFKEEWGVGVHAARHRVANTIRSPSFRVYIFPKSLGWEK